MCLSSSLCRPTQIPRWYTHFLFLRKVSTGRMLVSTPPPGRVCVQMNFLPETCTNSLHREMHTWNTHLVSNNSAISTFRDILFLRRFWNKITARPDMSLWNVHLWMNERRNRSRSVIKLNVFPHDSSSHVFIRISRLKYRELVGN